MTRLTVRKFEVDDYLNIKETDPVRIERDGRDLAKMAAVHAALGPAATVVDPAGRIVFCAGIHAVEQGTGELWAVFSPLAREYLQTPRVVREMVEAGGRDYVRLQAAVDPRWREAVRLVEWLGFTQEGLMKSYAGGRDMALYAKVRE